MTENSIVIGSLEFTRDGWEMFVNRLCAPDYDPNGDGDHIATAEGITDEIWEAFVTAARAGDIREGSNS